MGEWKYLPHIVVQQSSSLLCMDMYCPVDLPLEVLYFVVCFSMKSLNLLEHLVCLNYMADIIYCFVAILYCELPVIITISSVYLLWFAIYDQMRIWIN